MTAFLIVSVVLFLLSILSNIIFVLNENVTAKGGAVLGVIVFTGMIVWALTLLFQFQAPWLAGGQKVSYKHLRVGSNSQTAYLYEWYNFYMENLFDQEPASRQEVDAVVEAIIENTEPVVVDDVDPKDYTVGDEDGIDWSKL